jgi:hypothetical protein
MNSFSNNPRSTLQENKKEYGKIAQYNLALET